MYYVISMKSNAVACFGSHADLMPHQLHVLMEADAALSTAPLLRGSTIPNAAEIRARCENVFGLRPCKWQVEFAQAVLARRTDVLLEVATGMRLSLVLRQKVREPM